MSDKTQAITDAIMAMQKGIDSIDTSKVDGLRVAEEQVDRMLLCSAALGPVKDELHGSQLDHAIDEIVYATYHDSIARADNEEDKLDRMRDGAFLLGMAIGRRLSA